MDKELKHWENEEMDHHHTQKKQLNGLIKSFDRLKKISDQYYQKYSEEEQREKFVQKIFSPRLKRIEEDFQELIHLNDHQHRVQFQSDPEQQFYSIIKKAFGSIEKHSDQTSPLTSQVCLLLHLHLHH